MQPTTLQSEYYKEIFKEETSTQWNNEIVYNKNFEQKLIKMKSLLNLWYPRNLTLYGRITILKSLAISKLVYNTSVLTFPTKFIATVN